MEATKTRECQYSHRPVDRKVRAVECLHPQAPCVCRIFDATTGEFLGWGYETGELVAGPDGKDLPRRRWVKYEVVEHDHPLLD